MDIDPLKLVQAIWKHSGLSGHVWMPHIANIGDKKRQRFREGATLRARKPATPELRTEVDWYFTPAVSNSDSRKAKDYPAQRVLWVDCDESYNDELLTALKPSYVWETSPGHKQAVWLMQESIPASEYHRDGLMGMLTQALGGDKSGVDIGQLLRVPGTWHHKQKPWQGRVLSASGRRYTRGQLLTSVARGLGFTPQMASELGAEDPFGDRSKVLWRFNRNAAELGLDELLTFKLIKACAWNKWPDDADRLKEDIARAYAHTPERAPTKAAAQARDELVEQVEEDEVAEASPWDMATVDEFGSVIHDPLKWVLPGIIPESGCGLLVAPPKVGKTRIAIEVALGLATGRRPLGVSVQRPTEVGFFSLEDGEYLFSSRLNTSLNRDHGRHHYHWDGHITKDLVWHPPRGMDLLTNFAQVDLSDGTDQQRLYETIVKYDLKLVIIDTLSMAIGKADVSSSTDMYAILKPIKDIAKATGCAIMFIHHTRKRVFEKGESVQESILGSTALHGWSDFIMSLASPDEDNPNMLRLGVQTKMGNDQHYISTSLKIIKQEVAED